MADDTKAKKITRKQQGTSYGWNTADRTHLSPLRQAPSGTGLDGTRVGCLSEFIHRQD